MGRVILSSFHTFLQLAARHVFQKANIQSLQYKVRHQMIRSQHLESFACLPEGLHSEFAVHSQAPDG